MTQYLLSVIHADVDMAAMEEADMEAAFAAVDAFNTRLREDGNWVFAGGLEPVEHARTARLQDDSSAMVVDGPYLESKEALGGFWIVEADESEIDDIARRAAVACSNDVEVRPFQPEG